jgi:hypothetical protein
MSIVTRPRADMIDDDQELPTIKIDQPQDRMSPASRAEVDIQISTARAYPRSIKTFKQLALAMATLDEETASGCFYALPRSGKTIEGPSVRLSEIVVSAWGNIRADARVIHVGDKEIVAEGMCWDLERNIAIRKQVTRRITDKNNRRYSEDMIVVTGNAACSIAFRNAVFAVVPGAFVKSIYDAARSVAIGDAKTLANKRADMVAYFAKMGVQPDRLLAAINKAGVEDIGLDELGLLKGMATAIKDGDTTVDQAFPDPKSASLPATTGSAADRLISKLAPKAEQPPSEPAAPVEPPAPSEPADGMTDDQRAFTASLLPTGEPEKVAKRGTPRK